MTGYTSKVPKGQSFEEFVLGCARAMGALVLMRDDPMDAPIPEFQPSDFYKTRGEEAQRDLDAWDAMTDEQKRGWANAEVLSAKKAHDKYAAEVKQENDACDAMLAKVRAWKPPTADHEQFKAFMIDQLTISKSDYPPRQYDCATADERIASRRGELLAEVARSTQEYAKEVERTNGRNAWVNALKGSLATKEPAGATE